MGKFKENLKKWLIPALDDTIEKVEINETKEPKKKKQVKSPRVFMVFNYNEAQEIANHLLVGQDVIVNITNLALKDKYRVVDFLSGVIYVKEGKRTKLEANVYLFSLN